MGLKGKLKLLSCLGLYNPMDYTLHGIFQARILEWVAFPLFKWSSQPRDRTPVSCIAGRFFTNWAIKEALWALILSEKLLISADFKSGN